MPRPAPRPGAPPYTLATDQPQRPAGGRQSASVGAPAQTAGRRRADVDEARDICQPLGHTRRKIAQGALIVAVDLHLDRRAEREVGGSGEPVLQTGHVHQQRPVVRRFAGRDWPAG